MRTRRCGACGRRKPRTRMFIAARYAMCRNGWTCIEEMLRVSRQVTRKQHGESRLEAA